MLFPMKRSLSLCLLLLCFLFSFRAGAQQITIAAAADLRFAMDEMVADFNKVHPEIKVSVSYGSSGNLYQQIVNKAPFSIFFSADISFARKLDSLKLTATPPKLYAIGHLVLWSASADVSKGMGVLASDEVKKIAIANPAVAPYGKRAVECLKYYHLYDRVEEKIVRGENISQAAQFVLTGNAEAGLIALSLALSPEMMSKGKYLLIDEASYSRLEQACVVLKDAGQDPAVATFTNFIGTEQARRIFKKYGFNLPGEK